MWSGECCQEGLEESLGEGLCGETDEITRQVDLGCAEKRWTALAGSGFLGHGILVTTTDNHEMS